MDHLEHLKSCTVCEATDDASGSTLDTFVKFETDMLIGDDEGVYKPDLVTLYIRDLHANEIVSDVMDETARYYTADPEGFDADLPPRPDQE